MKPGIVLVAADMGYGHLRAAHALADHIGCPVHETDRPPLAGDQEVRRWRRSRALYEAVSRASQVPVVGAPLRHLLDTATSIPRLYPYRDQSAPTASVWALERAIDNGLGSRLVDLLKRTDATLLTTFYSPAIVAHHGTLDHIVCVITDSDLNRIWVPSDGRRSTIHYCAPSERARRRLRAYGVRSDHIHLTGFPLPPALLGGPELPALRANLALRLRRLDPSGSFRDAYRDELSHFFAPIPEGTDPEPPLLTFAIGGAGAQSSIARRLLVAFRRPIVEERLRFALVAGTRSELCKRFQLWVTEAGLAGHLGSAVQILHEPTFPEYYRAFSALLARTDVLWTKPSEMTFYAALGIPLILAPPVGAHERENQRWARERGAAFKQQNLSFAWQWLNEWLEDGVLAAAAWSGYTRLPKFGTYRIAEVTETIAGS